MLRKLRVSLANVLRSVANWLSYEQVTFKTYAKPEHNFGSTGINKSLRFTEAWSKADRPVTAHSMLAMLKKTEPVGHISKRGGK